MATRSNLVQKVLACGSTSAKTDIMARFCKFFQSHKRTPFREVAVVGKNIRLITEFSRLTLIVDMRKRKQTCRNLLLVCV